MEPVKVITKDDAIKLVKEKSGNVQRLYEEESLNYAREVLELINNLIRDTYTGKPLSSYFHLGFNDIELRFITDNLNQSGWDVVFNGYDNILTIS